MIENLHLAARRLLLAGSFDSIKSAREAVEQYVADNGIDRDRFGNVSYSDFLDIVAELKG